MHQRIFRGSALAALVIAIALIAASAATAGGSTPTTVTSNQTYGTTSCPAMTGPGFQQNGYCFFFPNGSATPSALCDPMFCGSETYNLANPGTFTATLTYPSPNGFTLLGLGVQTIFGSFFIGLLTMRADRNETRVVEASRPQSTVRA